MKILYNFNESTNILEFTFKPGIEDTLEYTQSENLRVNFVVHRCKFILPLTFRREHLHNDIVALCALLLVYPFIGDKIIFEFPISKRFADNLETSGKNIVYYKTETIVENEVSSGTDGVNFNSSVESIAASEIVGEDSVLAYLDVWSQNKDFQYLLMDMSYIRGKRVVALKTDANLMFSEFYKNKPTRKKSLFFDLAEYIPLLLLSKFYSIKYINFNSFIRDFEQLEMDYKMVNYHRTSRWKFYNINTSYKNINRFSYWTNLIASVGLSVRVPLGGITRAGIYKIIKNSPLYEHLPLCTNGFIGSTCENCKSCLIHLWMRWYYDNEPLEFDMDKLKTCKIIYAYTLYHYREAEHIKSLYEAMKRKYPNLDLQMRTLQKYRTDSIIGNKGIFDKLKSHGLDKFSNFI